MTPPRRRAYDDYRARRARVHWDRALVDLTEPRDQLALAAAIGKAEGLTPTWALRVRTPEQRRACAELRRATVPLPVQAPVPVAAPVPAPPPVPVPAPPEPRAPLLGMDAGLGPWARVEVWRHGHGYRWRATWAPPCEPDSAQAYGSASDPDAAAAAARAWVEGLGL